MRWLEDGLPRGNSFYFLITYPPNKAKLLYQFVTISVNRWKWRRFQFTMDCFGMRPNKQLKIHIGSFSLTSVPPRTQAGTEEKQFRGTNHAFNIYWAPTTYKPWAQRKLKIFLLRGRIKFVSGSVQVWQLSAQSWQRQGKTAQGWERRAGGRRERGFHSASACCTAALPGSRAKTSNKLETPEMLTHEKLTDRETNTSFKMRQFAYSKL